MCNIHTANSWLNELPARGKTKCTMYIYKTNDAMNYTYRLGLAPHNFKHLNVMCQALFSFCSFHTWWRLQTAVGQVRSQLLWYVPVSPNLPSHCTLPSLQARQEAASSEVALRMYMCRSASCVGWLATWFVSLCGLAIFASWRAVLFG